ncbi:MAG: transcriptional repressor [Verrucomicrobia bacterium]|nr:transcriptional repressor [Verrucomicrobiota bacterium]
MDFAGESRIAKELNERLATSGFRSTAQREHVYGVLLAKRDHPTAEEVFLRAKPQMPDISIATVYNCLDALVKCGLVRQVNVDRGATRFCPNMKEHCHFYCSDCGGVYDIGLAGNLEAPPVQLPEGFTVEHFEVSVRGVCNRCAAGKKQ